MILSIWCISCSHKYCHLSIGIVQKLWNRCPVPGKRGLLWCKKGSCHILFYTNDSNKNFLSYVLCPSDQFIWLKNQKPHSVFKNSRSLDKKSLSYDSSPPGIISEQSLRVCIKFLSKIDADNKDKWINKNLYGAIVNKPNEYISAMFQN